MIFELIYTSVPKGLKPGSSGYTTVACTEGMPAKYVSLCESLSGYIHLYADLNDPNYRLNPVAYSHYKFSVNNEKISVLSRVSSSGADYSGRANKIAHHIVVLQDEQHLIGPAALMNQPGLFVDEWNREPQILPKGRIAFPENEIKSYFAEEWENVLGDAGAAGVLAQKILDNDKTPAFILFEPGTNLLQLIIEAMDLLPLEQQWATTFNTYFDPTIKPIDSECIVRCCVRNSKHLNSFPDALVMDLPQKKMIGKIPKDAEIYECARTGNPPSWLRPKKDTDTETFIEGLWESDQRSPSPRRASPISQKHPTSIIEPPTKKKSDFEFYLWSAVIILLFLIFIYFPIKNWLAPESNKNQPNENGQIDSTQNEEKPVNSGENETLMQYAPPPMNTGQVNTAPQRNEMKVTILYAEKKNDNDENIKSNEVIIDRRIEFTQVKQVFLYDNERIIAANIEERPSGGGNQHLISTGESKSSKSRIWVINGKTHISLMDPFFAIFIKISDDGPFLIWIKPIKIKFENSTIEEITTVKKFIKVLHDHKILKAEAYNENSELEKQDLGNQTWDQLYENLKKIYDSVTCEIIQELNQEINGYCRNREPENKELCQYVNGIEEIKSEDKNKDLSKTIQKIKYLKIDNDDIKSLINKFENRRIYCELFPRHEQREISMQLTEIIK